MDDPQFIISQIRHSCVTSDDTGKIISSYWPKFMRNHSMKISEILYILKQKDCWFMDIGWDI